MSDGKPCPWAGCVCVHQRCRDGWLNAAELHMVDGRQYRRAVACGDCERAREAVIAARGKGKYRPRYLGREQRVSRPAGFDWAAAAAGDAA